MPFNLFSTFHRYFTSFEYNSPPVVVINTDYTFIRLLDKSNGKDWCQTDKRKTYTDKPQLYVNLHKCPKGI